MSDTIDRQAAIKAVCESGDAFEMIERLNSLPSAESEIIRCKDCRWRKDQSGSTAWLPCRAIVTPSDFYCKNAERRTDEQDD